MELHTLPHDITVIYVRAGSFPTGIPAAFDQLALLTGKTEKRQLYGISYPEEGTIIYKAACEELFPGEASQLGCESFTILKGNYISVLVPDFMNNITAISRSFSELLAYPGIDPSGYCLEIYESKTDVRCMVPLKNNV